MKVSKIILALILTACITMAPLLTSAEEKRRLGDTDATDGGTITAKDIAAVSNHILGKKSLTGLDLAAANMASPFKSATLPDLLLIRDHVLGIKEIPEEYVNSSGELVGDQPVSENNEVDAF